MDRLTYKHDDRWCISGLNGKLVGDKYANYWGEAIDRLADYENTDLTPEEFKESVDFTLELNKKLRNIVRDLIKEYENMYAHYEWEDSWNNGAVEALEELLKRLND